MASYILALDQGTTGSTVMVFDQRGRVLGRAYSEFKQFYPKPAWVEHDAEEIWRVTYSLIAKACRSAGIRPADLAAIGITNQRETTVLWDRKSGRPLHRAIVWQDRRTAAHCQKLKSAGLTATVRRKTGLVIDPYFSATKLAWLLDNVRGARAKAARGQLAFGTIDSWLIWKLTGGKVHATDATNASRTLLYDIHDGRWSSELCDLFRVPMSMLPDVRDCADDYGESVPDLFGGKISIRGVAGDQQAAFAAALPEADAVQAFMTAPVTFLRASPTSGARGGMQIGLQSNTINRELTTEQIAENEKISDFNKMHSPRQIPDIYDPIAGQESGASLMFTKMEIGKQHMSPKMPRPSLVSHPKPCWRHQFYGSVACTQMMSMLLEQHFNRFNKRSK